jgi:hypothetical protein
MSRKLWFIDLAWLLFCGLLASVWCWTAARQLGATFDEPVYLIQGLHRWHTGSPDGLMRLGTMPLPVDVVTLPLVLLEKWRGETIDPVREWEQVIPWARAATLVFFWLLLVHGFLYARFLGGPWAGRLVVPLIAWEPSLLAHSALATTDVAITACLLALVYYFHRGRDAGWWRRVALPALWFGLALTAKASALVYAPVCLLVVGIGHLLQRADMPAASWLTKLTVGPTKLWGGGG